MGYPRMYCGYLGVGTVFWERKLKMGVSEKKWIVRHVCLWLFLENLKEKIFLEKSSDKSLGLYKIRMHMTDHSHAHAQVRRRRCGHKKQKMFLSTSVQFSVKRISI